MTERMLITKVVRRDDRADLIARGHRYKDLTLFDLSDLADVGIDFATLTNGKETACRFWAIYTLSEKRNKAGNFYKDVVALEATKQPATSTSTDTSAIVAELRAIKALLATLLQAPGPEPARDPYPADSPAADEPTTSTNCVVERLLSKTKPDSSPPPDNGHRLHFYELAATADPAVVDAILSAVAADHGFAVALECLTAETERGSDKHRKAIIARLGVLLDDTLVKTGQVGAGLIPGWQWRLDNDQLIEAGKRIKADIETAGGST